MTRWLRAPPRRVAKVDELLMTRKPGRRHLSRDKSDARNTHSYVSEIHVLFYLKYKNQ
jgi:hypothetical protein